MSAPTYRALCVQLSKLLTALKILKVSLGYDRGGLRPASTYPMGTGGFFTEGKAAGS
jgi:hypothetical protein